ncbi:Ig-like domain-containing protein [Actinoplanes palleronii]|uniref:DUF11 domain-containing protein n=1 Tax=Actinoplanes palleronii TaxID=113570 RepID=A0ABQ4BL02_9ACTN|nr:Ig-like domain-containing protein [Actinoplanes palleronii]GIE70930.1 hypothetical protein Apa02nite_070380 [Actinoplanes palleronii]
MYRAALRDRPYRAACLIVVLALAIVTGLTVLPDRANAAITDPFTSRFEVNANGSILLRGNTNLQCPAAVASCVSAHNQVGSASTEVLNNNGYDMDYTNADNDAGTFNDSAATITMPSGSTVLFAGLYWSADWSAGTNGHVAPSSVDIDKVRFSVPGGGWTALTADTIYKPASVKAFQGFKDVTRLVAGAGDGTYRVADIQSGTGRDRYAGWALAIAYQNSAEPMHSLRVFDGFGVVNSSSTSVNINVSGFQTPQTAPVGAKIGTVVYEGDLGKVGDTLKLDNVAMNDNQNPANNFFNSTVSEGGNAAGSRDPNWLNLMGVDIDQFDAAGKLNPNVTSAQLTLTTSGETFYPGVVTFTTDLFAPKLVTTTTPTDLTSGDLLPGDVVEYRVAVRNDGSDTASLSKLINAFPTGTTYVPNSLTVAGSPVADTGRVDGGSTQVTFDLGTLAYQASTYVTFQVVVAPTATAGSTVVNLPNVTFQGSTSLMTITGVSDTSTLTVQRPDVDRAAGLTVAPSRVQRAGAPNSVSYTATVTNNGPGIETRPVAELTLPAGVTAGTLPAGCVLAASKVTCTLGYLAKNTSGSVTVPAVADSTAATTTTASLTVSGAGHDVDTTNDTATAQLEVNANPRARSDAATTAGGTPVTFGVLGNDDDPENPNSDFSVSIAQAPAHGGVSVNADRTVTYTPDPAWRGADYFDYTLADGHGGTDTTTDMVTTANAGPVGHDDTVTTGAGAPVTIDVLANDTDPNGDTRTLDAVDPPQAGAGTTALSSGQVLFTPDPAFTGVAVFTYR